MPLCLTRAALILITSLALATPVRAQTAPGAEPETPTATGGLPSVPLPPPRPRDLAPPPPTPEPSGASDDDAACLERLVRMGVSVEPKPDLSGPSCGAVRPLALTQLPDGVAVNPPAIVTCPVAEALAAWILDSVIPAAGRLDSAATALAIGTSYECRNQRNGAKRSEHAFANAVDVMGISLWRRSAVPVASRDAGSPEGRFIAEVRAGACAHFTTVLGPGSDAAHADHLHLDRRGRKAGYRICQ